MRTVRRRFVDLPPFSQPRSTPSVRWIPALCHRSNYMRSYRTLCRIGYVSELIDCTTCVWYHLIYACVRAVFVCALRLVEPATTRLAFVVFQCNEYACVCLSLGVTRVCVCVRFTPIPIRPQSSARCALAAVMSMQSARCVLDVCVFTYLLYL